jgi:pyruvate/2-oxoglutarate dehydrogenase complex dihydrolipoamide acyltransferase (E2) component
VMWPALLSICHLFRAADTTCSLPLLPLSLPPSQAPKAAASAPEPAAAAKAQAAAQNAAAAAEAAVKAAAAKTHEAAHAAKEAAKQTAQQVQAAASTAATKVQAASKEAATKVQAASKEAVAKAEEGAAAAGASLNGVAAETTVRGLSGWTHFCCIYPVGHSRTVQCFDLSARHTCSKGVVTAWQQDPTLVAGCSCLLRPGSQQLQMLHPLACVSSAAT